MIVPKERALVPPQEVQLEKLLLVEGDTPAHFFEALLKKLGLANAIEIRNFGGITQLALFLRTIAATAGFRAKVRALAIIRDAEDDAESAKRSVNNAVTEAHLPKGVDTKVFILPDNKSAGMIESLCIQSISTRPVYQCVRAFIECAKSKGIDFPAGVIVAKHEAQVFLATLKKTQMMPGVATYHHAWALDDPVFDAIKTFIQSL